MEPIIIKNFINGEFFPTDEFIDSVDPATLEIVSKGKNIILFVVKLFLKVPRSNADDVDKAVKSAQVAFESWSVLPPAKRAQERINAVFIDLLSKFVCINLPAVELVLQTICYPVQSTFSRLLISSMRISTDSPSLSQGIKEKLLVLLE